jgi:diguanylate cyclase (GGDEF)-like protein
MLNAMRERIANTIFPEGRTERRSLERLANVDELTGLGNKRALMLALPAAERDPQVAILMFDMNNLGLANKFEGHKAGDRLIRRAARTIQIITKQLTGSARAFRFGGDEFVVFCDIAYAQELCNAIMRSFGSYEMQSRVTVQLIGTVGVSLTDADSRLQPFKKQTKAGQPVYFS